MPDYTKQLEEIARALNRPTTPPWLVTILSAILGFLTGIAGQLLMMPVSDAYRRYKTRRVLYLDLYEMFWFIHRIRTKALTDLPETERYSWQKARLPGDLRFRGEQYCEDNREIYFQLSERHAGETLYRCFHRILDEKNSLDLNTYEALRTFANIIVREDLNRNYFRRFLGEQKTASLMRTVAAYFVEIEETPKRTD